VKGAEIKQDTAPPMMMYGRDRAKLEALAWDAHSLYWSVQMWLIDGGNDYRMELPKHKLQAAAGRRANAKVLERAVLELVLDEIWTDAGDRWIVNLHHQIDIDVWRNPTAREKELRHKRLHRDTDLLARIKDRDRLLCRYCGVRTRWDGDKKSRLAGTYDHVDPDGGNEMANVVIACNHCNTVRKKDRTLEQAGMSLYVAGTTAADIADGRARVVAAASTSSAEAPDKRTRS
jgi:5-methylcytosine-specific restriction endonuclease McrA